MSSDSDAEESDDSSLPVRPPLQTSDPVRWLIDQQSFNGVWTFTDQDVAKLTNGKSLDAIQTTVTKDKNALCTALAIALLESKHAGQKNLWFAIAEKGRKALQRTGLSAEQINQLINEISKKL
jgi:hypothetical protein